MRVKSEYSITKGELKSFQEAYGEKNAIEEIKYQLREQVGMAVAEAIEVEDVNETYKDKLVYIPELDYTQRYRAEVTIITAETLKKILTILKEHNVSDFCYQEIYELLVNEI